MANPGKKPASKKAATSTKVTRITASDTKKTTKKESTPEATASQPTKKRADSQQPLGRIAAPFGAIGRYFKGAWYELRQVRWPNRKATWSLTAAMLVFTSFFAALILLLDALFKYLFQLILG